MLGLSGCRRSLRTIDRGTRASFAAMSTAQSLRSDAVLGRPPDRLARARTAARRPGAAVALTSALLLLVLYAAFDHGAGGVAAGARIQVAVAAIAAIAATAVVWTGTLRFGATRRAIVAVGLLAAFAVWSGISLAWSVAPNQTWLELNRALTYALVLGLAVVAGASHRRSLELAAKGFLLVTLAVALYGLGQKVIPGVHVAGLFNLDQTGLFQRLQEPFGYWNALALFIAMGIPIALAIAVDRSGSKRIRLLGLLSIEPLLLTLVLTYSRGGVLALVAGLAVGIAVSGARLRSLMWLALAVVGSLPPLVMALVAHDLTTSFVALSARERTGAELGGVVLVSMAVLWFVGSRLLVIEGRSRVSPERARRIGHLVVLVTCVTLVCGVIAVAFSSRGLTGSVTHAWDSFTQTKSATSVYSTDRLLSIDSENRWVWWKEAVGAFGDRPLGGWGAGSFPVVHLLYRRNTLSVTEAHSVPLQFLAETGIVGALLALGAYGLLLASGASAIRRRPAGGERLLAAALLAGASMYAVHACYDWDWDIPGVTLPALMMLGVLAGASRARRRAPEPAPVSAAYGVRAFGLGAIALTLCTIALSGALPSLAAGRARDAVVTAARSTPAALASAQSSAELANSLNPLSDAGLLVEAAIAIQRHDLPAARSYLLQAIGRDPTDLQPWEQLVFVDGDLRDTKGAIGARARVVALDPLGAGTTGLAERTELFAAPPNDSATAIPTP
jgi:O-Antigen ligase